jgi:hypothetical protein
MLIISAGTPDYHDMMAENQRRCREFGYRYVSHDLKPSTPEDLADLSGDLPPCTFKPRFLQGIPTDGEVVAWMDGDAFVVLPLDDLESLDFDVAVTLREPQDVGGCATTGYLNAGVIFFRGFYGSLFVDRWECLTDRMGNDQLALNNAVGKGWTDEQWKASYGHTHDCSGFKVHVLPGSIWNFSNWNYRPLTDTKILHLKHGWRALNGPNWWKYALTETNSVRA